MFHLVSFSVCSNDLLDWQSKYSSLLQTLGARGTANDIHSMYIVGYCTCPLASHYHS